MDKTSKNEKPKLGWGFSRTIKRVHLANALYYELGLARKESKMLVDSFAEIMTDAIMNGENTTIPFFGRFFVRQKPERIGVNFHTGKRNCKILPRKAVCFKAHKILKKLVDAGMKNG